jgi:hypothetical protein
MPSNSALVRPVDPRYPTNLAILLLAGAVAVSSALVVFGEGAGIRESAIHGVLSGSAVFLAWAIARELDPDEEYAAFAAAGLMVAALAIFPLPDLVFSLLVLLLLRIVNRSVGSTVRLWDTAAVLLLTCWALQRGSIVAGAAATAALLLDARLSKPTGHHLPAAALAFLATVAAFLLAGARIDPAPLGVIAAVVFATLSAIPLIAGSRQVRSSSDLGAEPLDPGRVRAAQVLGLLTAVAIALLGGLPAVVSALPLWTGLLGIGLFRVGRAVAG